MAILRIFIMVNTGYGKLIASQMPHRFGDLPLQIWFFFTMIEKEGSGGNLSNTTLEFNSVYCWELYVSKCINISKDLRKYVACVLQKHCRKVQIIYFKGLENSCFLKIFAQNLQNRLNQKPVWFTNCCFYSSCLGTISKMSRLHNCHKT